MFKSDAFEAILAGCVLVFPPSTPLSFGTILEH